MTNDTSLTPEQRDRLLQSYHTLSDLRGACRVPAVQAALRGALAELRVALDGQAVDLDDYYRPRPAEPAGTAHTPSGLAA